MTSTKALLALIVVLYVVTAWPDMRGPSELALQLGAFYAPLVLAGQWWRIITGTLLHANLTHLFYNGAGLGIFGYLLEPVIGSRRLAAVMVLTGLSALLASALFVNVPSIGASGVVFGLIGLYFTLIIMSRFSKTRRIPRQEMTSAFIFILFFVYGTNFTPEQVAINTAGHAGGFLGGVLCGLWLGRLMMKGKLLDPTLEIETKFVVPNEIRMDVQEYLTYRLPPRLTSLFPEIDQTPIQTVVMSDHYFDTPDMLLLQQGAGLRLRRTRAGSKVYLKTMASVDGKIRKEYVFGLSTEPDVMQWESIVPLLENRIELEKLLQKLGVSNIRDLRHCLVLNQERCQLRLTSQNHSLLTLSLDYITPSFMEQVLPEFTVLEVEIDEIRWRTANPGEKLSLQRMIQETEGVIRGDLPMITANQSSKPLLVLKQAAALMKDKP